MEVAITVVEVEVEVVMVEVVTRVAMVDGIKYITAMTVCSSTQIQPPTLII